MRVVTIVLLTLLVVVQIGYDVLTEFRLENMELATIKLLDALTGTESLSPSFGMEKLHHEHL